MPGGYALGELMTCTYCSFVGELGTHGPVTVCNNRESPQYDESHRSLSTEKLIIGCGKFSFSGRKLSVDAFRALPRDSPLRALSPGDIIENYVQGMEQGDPPGTMEELAGGAKRFYGTFVEVLEGADGLISLGELERRLIERLRE